MNCVRNLVLTHKEKPHSVWINATRGNVVNIIWQSKNFSEDRICEVYARRYSEGTIKLFDVDAKGKTIREYWLPEDRISFELPETDGSNIIRVS